MRVDGVRVDGWYAERATFVVSDVDSYRLVGRDGGCSCGGTRCEHAAAAAAADISLVPRLFRPRGWDGRCPRCGSAMLILQSVGGSWRIWMCQLGCGWGRTVVFDLGHNGRPGRRARTALRR